MTHAFPATKLTSSYEAVMSLTRIATIHNEKHSICEFADMNYQGLQSQNAINRNVKTSIFNTYDAIQLVYVVIRDSYVLCD